MLVFELFSEAVIHQQNKGCEGKTCLESERLIVHVRAQTEFRDAEVTGISSDAESAVTDIAKEALFDIAV